VLQVTGCIGLRADLRLSGRLSSRKWSAIVAVILVYLTSFHSNVAMGNGGFIIEDLTPDNPIIKVGMPVNGTIRISNITEQDAEILIRFVIVDSKMENIQAAVDHNWLFQASRTDNFHFYGPMTTKEGSWQFCAYCPGQECNGECFDFEAR
jgi:hypothetical protein